MTDSKNRLETLLDQKNFTGIDFVEIISSDQKTLHVHFLKDTVPPLQGTVKATTTPDGKTVIPAAQITGGETIPTVPVNPINDATDWMTDREGRPILILTVVQLGDFSLYTLTLNSPRLDLFFNQSIFSFKALSPSDLDCETPTPVCPPLQEDIPPIDYLAKDFLSFRQALSDFSVLRYPEWQERSEADFGVMFMEALCALADDLSYTQDRIAAEATLATATQRRSIVRHARLVDYEPKPATAAQVLLQLDVLDNVPIPSGFAIASTQGPDGATINFEIGTGLIDPQTGLQNLTTYPVNHLWNEIQPYCWDDSQQCLRSGSTDMWVVGQGFNFTGGQALLIETQGATTLDPKIREIVHLVDGNPAIEQTDFLYNQQVTHIFWIADDALKFDHDLTKTALAGNLIPAIQGSRASETFAIPADESTPSTRSPQPLALRRIGANGTPNYLYTLQQAPLAWLAQDTGDLLPLPAILLKQGSELLDWTWRRSLLQAELFESAFTIDPTSYSLTAHNSDGSIMQDYDGDGGDTIRFGDGIFGELPAGGTVFQVIYQVGGGARGNVPADSIIYVNAAAISRISAVNNPFPAAGGADAEPAERVRRLAPQAFRAVQYRAVRADDYQAAAQTLPWVLRAGTVFRWTGSWLTVFTTPDPKGSEGITLQEHTQLIELLNRYRLAGYESYVPEPQYRSLDLEISLYASPDAFRGDVEAAVLANLSAAKFPDGSTGFFYVDNFTFGTPLERSALEAAIQKAYGVAGIISIMYRQRKITSNYLKLPETLTVSANAILRLDNDPSRPERGSLKVIVEGGK
ncbi:baseplate J/gp47 family protein [uncultured Nostoc sp.]|uniref:baseplate J/gp47 family protein n=1 Tax=uncultured Nostoc sp. TaxID=340711 RepID=UPI0035CAFD70